MVNVAGFQRTSGDVLPDRYVAGGVIYGQSGGGDQMQGVHQGYLMVQKRVA